MKKFKATLASLMLMTALSIIAPTVTVRADEPGDGPQGTSDSRSRQSQSSSEAAARALLIWIMSWLS